MAHYDIFRERLAIKYPAFGHALWEPDSPVQVGDVGFIREGKFERLFNALLPADDPSHELGVPEYHEPLVPSLSDHIYKGSLSPNNYCSAGVSVGADPGYHPPDDFRQVSFQYTKTRGAAVLSLPVKTWRENTRAQGEFGKWMVKHIGSWFDFAQGCGMGIAGMEEIILVTGCDRTRSWTNIAFLGGQADAQVSFGVKVEDPGTNINYQLLPELVRGAVISQGPEGKNLPANQCVFVRGFRVARSFWLLPKHLKAAAGPSPDPGGYDCDPDTELVSIPAVTKYRDPLHLLLDYIAEQASQCDIVLAHDSDLMMIMGMSLGTSVETLEPEVMTDLIRGSNIEIHEVLCDSSPTNSLSDSSKNVASVKIAMLPMTFQKWNTTAAPPRSLLAAQNIDLGHTSKSRRKLSPEVPDSFADSIDFIYPHMFTPPASPIYASPLSTTFSAYDRSESDPDHIKPPDDISNQLVVLEQLRRSVQKNLRLRSVTSSPDSPPRSPTRPLSSASIWPDFTQARSSGPASTIASSSIYYTPLSDPKSPFSAHDIGPPLFDRPGPELPRSPARSVDPASLASRLDDPTRRPLLIDTRPAAAFLGCHLKSSVNLAIPSLILKRISRKPSTGFGSVGALRQFITTDPCRTLWDSIMAPGGSWDGDVIVYDEEMNLQDRPNAQAIAWALLPVISPLLVRGRADYLEGGMLAIRAYPDLQRFIASSGDSSLETQDQMQEQHSIIASPPPPPKLSLRSKPKKGRDLFQLDSSTAARSRALPELEASPVLSVDIFPGTAEGTSWNVTDASPSPPPSLPQRPSLSSLRKLDTKLAEHLDRPRFQDVRTVSSATLAAPPSAGLCPNGSGSNSPRAHSPSHPILTHINHTSPASARHGKFLVPSPSFNIPSSRTPLPPSPVTARPDLSAFHSTEEAIPSFTVSTILPNFLYLGPEITTEEHVRELQNLGVRRILNLAAECDDDHGLGLRQRFERYNKIPMRNAVEKENVVHRVREACEVLDNASLHSAPTFVHCKAGKSRSVAAVMAYLIHANHWTLSRAYTFVLERRKGISPNIGFVSELMDFEEAELGSKSVGVVKRPQSTIGGGRACDHLDSNSNSRGAAIGIGIGGRRPSHMRESLPPARSTSSGAGAPLSSVPRSVAGDVGQETEVKDATGRYRHARRAPVDENTLQPMRRVSKAGLERTTIEP